MKFLLNQEKLLAEDYIEQAKELARKATCKRAKCGALIVKDAEIIGEGFNSPPGNDEKERRCAMKKDEFDKKVTDKTCCVHAEQRAIMDALRNNPGKIQGSKLYFARFYPDGELRLNGGNKGKNQLYCTICAKMMFDVGIAEFVLLHVDGIVTYTKDEYLTKSYEYGKHVI